MLAAVFQGEGRVGLEEVEVPEIGPGDLLVEVEANTVCGTDVKIVNGAKPLDTPAIIGHEVAGRIARIGDDVDGYQVGDLVGIAPVIGCGRCHYCTRGMTNVCPDQSILGYDLTGGLSQYVRVPRRGVAAGNVVVARTEIPAEQLALAEPLSCCINGQEKVQVGLDDTVVILGAGPIGLFHLQLSRLAGASQVLVSEPMSGRRASAEELGASVTVDPTDGDLREAVLETTDGLGADVAIVCSPLPSLVDEAVRLCRKGGRIDIFAGMPDPGEATVAANLIHYNELRVTGTANSAARHYETAVRLIGAGRIDAAHMVTHRLPLSRVTDALELVEERQGMKIAVVPEEGD